MSFLLEALPIIGNAALGFVLGAIMGSFINALSYRLPRGISMITPRSSCPSCQHTLGLADLVPIGSYLCSGGRCRYCGIGFGRRYLYIELITASLTALCFVLLWGNWFLLPVMAMLGTLICRAVMNHERGHADGK